MTNPRRGRSSNSQAQTLRQANTKLKFLFGVDNIRILKYGSDYEIKIYPTPQKTETLIAYRELLANKGLEADVLYILEQDRELLTLKGPLECILVLVLAIQTPQEIEFKLKNLEQRMASIKPQLEFLDKYYKEQELALAQLSGTKNLLLEQLSTLDVDDTENAANIQNLQSELRKINQQVMGIQRTITKRLPLLQKKRLYYIQMESQYHILSEKKQQMMSHTMSNNTSMVLLQSPKPISFQAQVDAGFSQNSGELKVSNESQASKAHFRLTNG